MARPAAARQGAARKSLDSILLERRSFPPPEDFAAAAHPNAQELAAMHAVADADPAGFWADQAREHLSWNTHFRHVLDESQAPNYRWFADGTLNVAANCLDVHLHTRGAHPAIVFEAERGETRTLSYSELHAEVCRFANALKSLGITQGDRVVIYLPLVPEAVIAMLACARIGAIHSVVFGGFSALSLRDRIDDAGARLLITADGGWRAGHVVELKAAADKALAGGGATIERVVVLRRTGEPVHMEQGRDLWWHELLLAESAECEPVPVPAEHPLFLLYTSGSTGKPKGIQHSSAGYLLGAKLTTRWVFDLKPTDVFWCTADVGWVTGHSYVVYGPLANGATIVLYEGAPTWPDPGRFWQIIERHKVSIFYTAPTALRALMKLGDDIPRRSDLSSLRLLGSVGEPINPEAWMWYHRVIGEERCPIVDTWWQTETGAILIAPVPGVTATKPGSCTLPLPGIAADIVDDEGHSVTQPDRGGYLVIRRPWPFMLRTIWGDNQRYVDTYWARFQNRYYVAGDGAHRDADGYFWILGRIDDVLNVSGHRIGTMEVESALVAHPRVAEAAVVGKPHEVKGEAIFAYVICRGSRPTGDTRAFVEELRNWVGEQVGAIAKPDEIRFTEVLPKTRSGKIMRRLLRAIARGEEITQDVSTLENPAIVDQLRGVEAPAATPTARKAAAAKKAAATRSAAKAAPPKKAPAKKAPAKRAPAKKAPAKKAPAKKLPAKKAPVKKGPARKVPARKAPAKRAPARKRPAKKAAGRKSAAKTSAVRRPPAKRAPAGRRPARRQRVSKRAASRGRSRRR